MMERRMNTILITGGAGFIGSNLCRFLVEKGYKVLCLDNFDGFYSAAMKRENIEALLYSERFKLIEGDIRDGMLLRNIFTDYAVETVIHLAAKAGVRSSFAAPELYFDVNVTGSLVLLEAMKSYGIRNLIFASSSSVYGEKEGALSETSPCNRQISPYAVSKKTGELLNYNYHLNYGINVINLRLFSIYGQQQRPDLAIRKFLTRMLEDEPIELYGEGSSKRDYTHVNDALKGFYGAINFLEHRQGIYENINIGSDAPVSLIQLLALLKEVAGIKKLRTVVKEAVMGDVKTTHADINKAYKLLNYKPTVSLDRGVRLFYNWFKQKVT